MSRLPRLRPSPGSAGFTLIELIVVITIIAVLAAVALPRLIETQRDARIAKANATYGALRSALALGWGDFEDAVTAAAARRAKCHAIVTRDPKGFPRSPVRVVTPDEAVAWLAAT